MNRYVKSIVTILWIGMVGAQPMFPQTPQSAKAIIKPPRLLELQLRFNTQDKSVKLTNCSALWLDEEYHSKEPGNYIFEYITVGGNSIKVLCTGGPSVTTADDSPSPVDKIDVVIPTDEDGKGFRLYDAKNGNLLAEKFFQVSAKEPKIELTGNPDLGFKVTSNQETMGIWGRWSHDEGLTWFTGGGNSRGKEFTFLPIPAEINPGNRRFMVDIRVFVDLRMYRKRFLYDGGIKPLPGLHPPIYKSAIRQTMKPEGKPSR